MQGNRSKPMNAPDTMKPRMQPFLPVTADFASGKDSPREFLERCLIQLDAWEPKIGAFVTLNLAGARTAADRSTKRWRAGKPLSPIDGMPIGIKDIIETIDMPTENGSPLFAGFRSERDAASVAALREAGAIIVGKTVTTEFAWMQPRATRNPWDETRTPGGSSSGSAAAVAVGAISVGIGTQVFGSIVRPSSFCGCFGFKPTVGAINRGGSHDALSQSTHGPLAASLEEAWQVAYEISHRAGGDPGFSGLYGPPTCPTPSKPRRLAILETDGWAVATSAAKDAFGEASAKLKSAGVTLVSRRDNEKIAAVEDAIHDARELSHNIIAWESRWPLNTYRARDASKLSQPMLELAARAQALTLDDYRREIRERDRRRAVYQTLMEEFDACVTLSAPGAAPVGLNWTGDPAFVIPGSMLGVPALSLPVLQDDGLPLGLQLLGFADADAALFSTAGGVLALLQQA
jgi:Asp-tRNA(Asn)/Glu-tRNA(Gln) amidotransferase A subunit family amidase